VENNTEHWVSEDFNFESESQGLPTKVT